MIAIFSNTEVVLGKYKYPYWAHIIGWLIVSIILSPLFKFAFEAMYNGGVFKVFRF